MMNINFLVLNVLISFILNLIYSGLIKLDESNCVYGSGSFQYMMLMYQFVFCVIFTMFGYIGDFTDLIVPKSQNDIKVWYKLANSFFIIFCIFQVILGVTSSNRNNPAKCQSIYDIELIYLSNCTLQVIYAIFV